jgi:hypothetical protein
MRYSIDEQTIYLNFLLNWVYRNSKKCAMCSSVAAVTISPSTKTDNLEWHRLDKFKSLLFDGGLFQLTHNTSINGDLDSAV